MAQKNTILLKIVILGESGVGKTSLAERFVREKFDNQYSATVGADFLQKTIDVDNHRVNLQIWDTAGQERFHSLGTSFYRNADCCLLVYDVTSDRSFRALNECIQEFLVHGQPKNPETFPFIVIGNKIDLPNRIIIPGTAQRWCKERNISYFETSAKDGEKVAEAFVTAARKALTADKIVNLVTDFSSTVRLHEENKSNLLDSCSC